MRVLPNQLPGLRQRAGLSREQLDRAAWAIDSTGTRYAGAAAANRVLRELPRWRWYARLYDFPPFGWLEDRAYDWIAAHRGRFSATGVVPECERPGVECVHEP